MAGTESTKKKPDSPLNRHDTPRVRDSGVHLLCFMILILFLLNTEHVLAFSSLFRRSYQSQMNMCDLK